MPCSRIHWKCLNTVGRTYELKVEKTTVGRVEDNTFHIAEPSVSSHHAEIILRGNDVIVKDLNSTNGTFINGEKITEAPLKPGQTLRLGTVEMRLEGEGGAGAPAPGGKSTSASAPAAAKKDGGETRRIQRGGVKLNELETGTGPAKFEKDSPFAKKTNKTTVIFISIAIVLGLAIIVSIIIALKGLGGAGGGQ